MNRREFVTSGTAALAVGAFPSVAAPTARGSRLPPAGADGWVSLLNGHDLSGWYSVLETSGIGVAETRGMVAMEEGMLHVMGNVDGPIPAEPGYLSTKQEFENVHIRLEYRWGVKRFEPRRWTKRDNGLLYGLSGKDEVWPTCIECQIQEGDVGDYFMVKTRGLQDEHLLGLVGVDLGGNGWTKPPSRMLPPPPTPPAGAADISAVRKIKDGDFEVDGWNTVEVIWQGDRSVHIVNGRAVNAASALQRPDPSAAGGFVPLTSGRIAIEIEFAEIWFRRIEVRSLV